jgi:uncharacterized protein (TIGR03437 family)
VRFAIRWAFLLLAAAATPAQVRVDPEVRTRAAAGDAVHVFLLLTNQPQRAIAGKGLPRREAAAEIDRALGPVQDGVARRLEAAGARETHRYRGVNMIAAIVPAQSLAALESMPEIAEIALAGEGRGALATSVPALGAPAFWSAGFTGAGQAIAVMDTGLRANHPAFAGIRVAGRAFHATGRNNACYADDPTGFTDINGHGTRVAGMAAGRGFPDQGVARGLDALYIAKVLFHCNDASFPSGRYFDTDVVAGLDWVALETPARIVNFSAGSTAPVEDSFLARLFDDYAETYGLSIVVAAGNSGSGATTLWSPGVARNVISVANLDHRRTVDREDDIIAASSSRGPTRGGRFKPDIAAPGTLITAPSILFETGTPFVAGSGTSFAAPHIAGALALLRQAGVTRPLAAKALLLSTADGTGWRPDAGWGSANLARAGSAIESTVAAGTDRYYRVFGAGAFRAMLASYRRTDAATMANLAGPGLSVYHLADGALLGASGDALQNVQQVTGSALSYVVRVAPGEGDQPFGLAVSGGVLSEAGGPRLAMECMAPPEVSPAAVIALDCRARNTGDLRAFEMIARAGEVSESIGLLEPGGLLVRRWLSPVPAGVAQAVIPVSLTSTSYDRRFEANGTVAVRIEASLVPATLRAVGGNDQRGPVGTALAQAVTVEVLTATGQPSPGIEVTFAAANASVSPARVFTDAQGRASAVVVLGSTPGPATVTASATIGSARPSIEFTATATQAPPRVLRLANGASFQDPVAPGSIVSVGGFELAASTVAASTVPLPIALGGTSMMVNGRPAPLFYVSPSQINAQIPVETPPGPAAIVVTTAAGASAELAATISPAAPGIFVYDGTRAVAQNQDLALNTRDWPAFTGSVITLYLTGQGPLDNPVATGAAASSEVLSRATLEASATIGGRAAEIQFLGMTPGLVGVLQANLRVPALAAGHHPVQITIGSVTSNAPVITVFALP